MERRTFILGALACPFVIRTPGLIMPIRPVNDFRSLSDLTAELYEALRIVQEEMMVLKIQKPPAARPRV